MDRFETSDGSYDAKIYLSNKTNDHLVDLERLSMLHLEPDYLYMLRLFMATVNHGPRSTNEIMVEEDATVGVLKGGETLSGTRDGEQPVGNEETREAHKAPAGKKRVKSENKRRGHKKRSTKRCKREAGPREEKASEVEKECQVDELKQAFEKFMSDLRRIQRVKNKAVEVEKELKEKSEKIMAILNPRAT